MFAPFECMALVGTAIQLWIAKDTQGEANTSYLLLSGLLAASFMHNRCKFCGHARYQLKQSSQLSIQPDELPIAMGT
jgi:hypothetical protein